jgi:hypothetical protein
VACARRFSSVTVKVLDQISLISQAAISGTLYYSCVPYLLLDAERHLLAIARVFVTFIVLNHLRLNLQAVNQEADNFGRFNRTRGLLYPV